MKWEDKSVRSGSVHFDDHPILPQVVAQIESNPNLQQLVAKITLTGFNKPIGVSEYELTRTPPDDLKSSLPTVEEIEAELAGEDVE